MNNWILCSKRLPEVGEGVKWVTVRGHDVIKCEPGETLFDALERTMDLRWVTQSFYDHNEKEWINGEGFPLIVQPIAWMDLDYPEPYDGPLTDPD